MLRQMRSGALSGLFLVFLLLGGLGLVLTDWGGFFTGGVAPSNVAEVGSEDINFQSFNEQVRQYIGARNISPDIAYRAGIVDQLLRSRIESRLLSQKAQELGLKAPDYLVAERLRPVVDSLVSRGLSREDALTRLASQNGMTSDQFINTLRDEFAQRLLFDTFKATDTYIPKEMAVIIARYQSEQRGIKALFFPHNAVQNIPEPSEDDLKAHYESRKSAYALPETRVLEIAALDPESIRDELSVSDQEMREEYEIARDNYVLPEKRQITQAVLTDEQSARSVFEKVMEGQSLKAAVKDVTGNTQTYRDPETYDATGLPEKLADSVFTTSENDVAPPVQTALGWHVVKVNQILPSTTLAYEKAKEDIREALINRQLDNIIIDTVTQLDDALAGGSGLQEVSEAFDMDVIEIGPLTQNGQPLPSGEQDASNMDFLEEHEEDKDYILENGFALPEGEISQVLELSDGSIVAIRATLVKPQRFKPFESVQSDVIKSWEAKERAAANFKQTQKYLESLKNGETTLKAVQEQTGQTLRSFDNLKRDQEPGEIIGKTVLEDIFKLKRDSYFMTPTSKGFLLGRVENVSLKQHSDIEGDTLTAIRENHSALMHTELTGLYVQHLAEQGDVEINRPLLEKMYADGAGEMY